jgi:lipoprotein-anchoring transpeptidase ErfK/SrfK
MQTKAPLAGAALAVALFTGTAAHADPYARTGSVAQSNMGGGFIEFVMTGRNPGRQQAPPQAYAPAPQAHAPEPRAYPPHGYRGGQLPMEPATRQPHGHQQAALNPDYRQVERALDPMYLPQVVDYAGPHKAGTVVIDTNQKFLFLVEGDGRARRYGIGVGRPGFEWSGVKSITRKAEWPDWRPPEEMLKRRPDLPRYMAGGPENPMGARGLYLGSSLYRIHGTNEPHTIGQAVSSGCIRMRNEDVTDLYERVRVGTKVIVI